MLFRKKNKSDLERRSTNQQSQRVFSYYTATRKQLNDIERQSSSKSLNTRRRRSLKNILFIGFLIVSVIIMLAYLSLLDTKPQIQINGEQIRPVAEYQSKISEILKNDPRNRTKYLLNKERIQNDIHKQFPELTRVKVGSSLLDHRPEIKIDTAKPMALFVQNDNKEKYILSNHGKIVISTNDSSYNYTNLPVIYNGTSFRASVGMQFFRPIEAEEIAGLIYQLQKDNSSFSLRLNSQPHEIDLYEKGKGYYVKYLLDDNSILKQYGAMRAVQNKQVVVNEYMDVRLADKVFYK